MTLSEGNTKTVLPPSSRCLPTTYNERDQFCYSGQNDLIIKGAALYEEFKNQSHNSHLSYDLT